MPLYQRLERTRSEIRLLTLHSSEWDQEIECSLEVASLDVPCEFEALSYVWGDMSNPQSVTIDGTRFEVTVNLAAALRRLRSHQRTQIPLMGRIYRTANTVLVWLGEKHSGSLGLAVSWIQTYVTKEITSPSSYWLALDTKARTSTAAMHKKFLATQRAYLGGLTFRTNRCWTRMWTFQEFRLPWDEPLCINGPISFRASHLMEGIEALFLAAREKFPPEAKTLNKLESDGELDRLNLLQRRRLQQLADADTKVQHARLFPKSDPGDWESGTSLLWLLWMTRARHCFDPRDKVYALQGLLFDPQERQTPDYNKPAPRLMEETTATLLNNSTDHLEALTFFPLRSERLTDTTYASWMLDLTLTRHYYHDAPPITRLLLDPAGTINHADVESGTLHIGARHIGNCFVNTRFDSSDEESNRMKLSAALRDCDTTDDSGSITRRQLRVCYPGNRRWVDSPPARQLDYIRRAFAKLAVKKQVDPEARDIVDDIARRIPGKALIKAGGRLGICPNDVQDGDLVVLPSLLRHPLVLRQEQASGTRDASHARGPYYRLVGPARFEGISNKEGRDGDFLARISLDPPTQFEIH